jgi:hypothetical protein
VFHAISRAFDAWDETLCDHPDEDLIRQQRAADLQEFVERLTRASTCGAPVASGDVAADATMKWGWERPPGIGGKKVERRGNDGDAGKSVSLTEVLDGTEPRDGNVHEVVVRTRRVRRTKRKRTWPKTWSLGAEWAGRPNKAKSVHGYALHSTVRAGVGEPNLIETFTLTPAAAAPAPALVPILGRYAARLAADPALPGLGRVIADPGYSAASIDDWQLPLQDLGASPIFRLHRTNQEPARWIEVGKGRRKGDVLFHHGRPMCECAALHPSIEERYPKWPHTAAELADYQRKIAQLEQFRWIANGAAKRNGSRQFLAPHAGTGPDGNTGGCEYCTTASGDAVQIDGRDVPRCCQTPSRMFSRRDLALLQEEPYGLDGWNRLWNQRNRVEGSYGIMKHRSILDWGRDFHHFVGLARETVVAAFAVVAYNLHMLRSWRARQALAPRGDRDDEHDPFAPERLTATMPPKLASRVAGEQLLRAEEASTRLGPKGLEFLAHDPPG